ncbi:MAG TPA: alpha/beta hydrolase [Candidatus Saccharimonadales bacterium]|nr:alpha/beta hydrolase [Candidatus Saccharimonadales bacterium]
MLVQRLRFHVENGELADLPQKRREVCVDGKRLETLLILPTPDAPVMVMLHEGLGSIAMWKDFPQRIAEATSCGVLVYSRYGHGQSQRLAEKRSVDFMHQEAKAVLPELLGQFEIQRPILLGHSDGGSIALIYAGTWPERVRGLVLEAPHVFVEDFGLRSTVAIREAYESTELREKLARYHDHVDETFRGWNDIWLDPRFREWNIEEYLDAITCPTLVIQGEDDEYGTVAHVEAIQRRVPRAQTLILRRCGHSPHRDQPELTLDAISKFVTSISV